ncbi:unnamed protein product [Cyclocybe aegerita]|uniref:Uncharacterized protein n=1 Tax=Cyclocybe aegerita TaxID=1973307 RepID=A0A8S0WD61_CYCAE|nr:unnamed protein product [Cyclocybe aegerita]
MKSPSNHIQTPPTPFLHAQEPEKRVDPSLSPDRRRSMKSCHTGYPVVRPQPLQMRSDISIGRCINSAPSIELCALPPPNQGPMNRREGNSTKRPLTRVFAPTDSQRRVRHPSSVVPSRSAFSERHFVSPNCRVFNLLNRINDIFRPSNFLPSSRTQIMCVLCSKQGKKTSG